VLVVEHFDGFEFDGISLTPPPLFLFFFPFFSNSGAIGEHKQAAKWFRDTLL